MKVRLLAAAALALVSGVAYAATAGVIDLQHLLALDWNGIATGGALLLANGPLAIPDQIKKFEARREEAQRTAEAIMQKAVEEGRTLDEHETEQHEAALADVKAVDAHIDRLNAHQATMAAKATTIDPNAGRDNTPAGSVRGAGAVEGRSVLAIKSNLPPGIRFTRFALSMAVAKGNVMQAREVARARFKDTPEVGNALEAAVALGGTRDLTMKAAVPFGTTTDTAFAGPLVQYQDMEAEFVELLRPATILGRLDRLNRVPFMMRTARQLTGVTGSFVGEGQPKPVGKQTYDNVTLGFAKAAVIVVLTDELVRFSSPNAELRARNDMVAGIAQYLDMRFIDPSYSGVPNVSPASITNAANRIQASGSSIAAIDADVAAAFAMFTNGNINPATAVWVMSAATALKLSMKRDAEDKLAYPTINMMGGTWQGLPVIVSNAMTAAGSPGEQQIALVTQEEVFLADEGGISIDMSNEASVQMNDTPSGGAQSLVSLWQNNLIGLRAERYINWAPRRPGNAGIALIENVGRY